MATWAGMTVKQNTQTKKRFRQKPQHVEHAAAERHCLWVVFLCQLLWAGAHKVSSTSTQAVKQSPQVRCGTQRGNSTRKEQQAMDGSPSVEAVSSVSCVSEPWRHKHPAVFLQAEGWPPQVQQGLSMTSVTSMPYTSSRSTRKERSPWGSSPMALTWSAVRVGSMLPATSDRVWKMRLFSSMKNLGQRHRQSSQQWRGVSPY